jgi:aspartyl-tRNA(Asn)/glutamyl-tRNA(Gln) amidotransferase subunit C
VSEIEIDKLAQLAQLQLSETEKEELTKDLQAIVGYVDQLSSVDVQSVEGTQHTLDLVNGTREDVVQTSLDWAAASQNAPATAAHSFKVPRVLGDS